MRVPGSNSHLFDSLQRYLTLRSFLGKAIPHSGL